MMQDSVRSTFLYVFFDRVIFLSGDSTTTGLAVKKLIKQHKWLSAKLIIVANLKKSSNQLPVILDLCSRADPGFILGGGASVRNDVTDR